MVYVVMEDALSDLLSRLDMGGEVEGAAEPPPPKVLEELSLEGVVKHIRKIQASDNSEQYNILSDYLNWLLDFFFLFQSVK